MSQTMSSPIGSSSGLLQTLESPQPLPHGSSPRMAGIAGLATSVALHAALLVAGVFLIQQMPAIIHSDVNTAAPQPFNPETTFDLPSQPQRLASPDKINPTQLPATFGVEDGEDAMKSASAEFNATVNKDFGKSNPAPAIALGGDGKSKPFQSLGTAPTGDGKQRGLINGEKIPFMNLPGGPGGPTHSPVAQRVLFLCDATGTMTGLKFDLLKRELNSTVGKLKPTTSFNVIFFADEKAEAFDKALQPATPQNKRKMGEFLAKSAPRGATNPLPGLKQAFAMNPEVVFFLSDGAFDNLVSYDEVLKTVDALNKDRKVRVYTILFGDRDAQAEQTLKKMAADHGGSFSLVSTEQLLK